MREHLTIPKNQQGSPCWSQGIDRVTHVIMPAAACYVPLRQVMRRGGRWCRGDDGKRVVVEEVVDMLRGDGDAVLSWVPAWVEGRGTSSEVVDVVEDGRRRGHESERGNLLQGCSAMVS